jgi:hypothetical protein
MPPLWLLELKFLADIFAVLLEIANPFQEQECGQHHDDETKQLARPDTDAGSPGERLSLIMIGEQRICAARQHKDNKQGDECKGGHTDHTRMPHDPGPKTLVTPGYDHYEGKCDRGRGSHGRIVEADTLF